MSETPRTESPIACTLDSEAQAARQQRVTDQLFARVESMEELDDGYAYRFPGDHDVLEQLTAFVLFERQCCPFLTFELIFASDQGPATLHLRGPEGTKAFLDQNLLIG